MTERSEEQALATPVESIVIGADELPDQPQFEWTQPYGATESKLILHGYFWPEDYEHRNCVHGVKVRWQCDYCDEIREHLAEREGEAR